ncbi:MAG: lipoprotein [Cohaesibacteraceae bacterium]|nr:lipoprotein [Cohaesibacteraceae bacterium]
MTKYTVSRVRQAIILIALSAILSACGQKGPLKAPESKVVTEGAIPETESIVKDDRPFVLDPLL